MYPDVTSLKDEIEQLSYWAEKQAILLERVAALEQQ